MTVPPKGFAHTAAEERRSAVECRELALAAMRDGNPATAAYWNQMADLAEAQAVRIEKMEATLDEQTERRNG